VGAGDAEWRAISRATANRSNPMQTPTEANVFDPHFQLRELYKTLIEHQDLFDEFRQLIASYPRIDDENEEPSEARVLREVVTRRVRTWTGLPVSHFSPMQMLLWRNLIVDERINVAIAPWKESNMY
jgi:hypothetical protein